MAKEIERKYLVTDKSYRKLAKEYHHFIQGYLSTEKGRTVRVRIYGDTGYITIKGANVGITRAEYEYKIPFEDALNMLNDLCQHPLIDKYRYIVEYDGHRWEIDEFSGDNDGLVVAEIELKSENEQYKLPSFIGADVSDDRRYYNSMLSLHPYKEWKE